MIFTATAVARSQSSSQEFKSYGAQGFSPAVVSDVRVFATPVSALGMQRRRYINASLSKFVGWMSFGEGSKESDTTYRGDKAYQKQEPMADQLFHIPAAVTTIGHVNDQIKAAAKEAGYTLMTSQRYKFFQGPSTDSAMKAMAVLGADMAAFAPAERVSFTGAMAGFVIRRLLYSAFLALRGNFQSGSGCGSDLPKEKISFKTRVSNIHLIPGGHFFPYFDGMLHPDKNIILDFIDLFHMNLGETDVQRKTSISLLSRGWSSLAYTAGGKIASHMIYALRLARLGGFRIRPIYNNESYVGMLLTGDGEIFQHGKWIKPTTGDVLLQEIQSMTSHQEALEEIAVHISASPLRKPGQGPATQTVTAEELTTPRRIHYALKERKFPDTTEIAITGLLTRLRFKQTFFNPSDDAHLLDAITAMKKGRLDPDAPCDYLGGNMFTTKKIMSALLAYGPVAPSPLQSQAANVHLNVSEGMLKGTRKQGTLEGVPLFIRPIQQAFEDWSFVKENGTVSFFTKGSDKLGRMRIKNLNRYVMTDEDLGKQVLKSMVKLVTREKRKRGVEEGEEEVPEHPKTKKARHDKKARLDLDAQELFQNMGFAEGDDDATMEEE